MFMFPLSLWYFTSTECLRSTPRCSPGCLSRAVNIPDCQSVKAWWQITEWQFLSDSIFCDVFTFNFPSSSSSVLTLAGVGVASLSWSPGQVVVKVITLLTVQTIGVVVTHTPAVNLKKEISPGVKAIYIRWKTKSFEMMRVNYRRGKNCYLRSFLSCNWSLITHHSFYIIPDAIDRGALRSVAIAKAVSTYDKLIYGIVILFFDFSSGVQQVVS